MTMLLGPVNGSTMVRHVLDVREGALPSNHTIPTLSIFPHFKYKHSKNKNVTCVANGVSDTGVGGPTSPWPPAIYHSIPGGTN
jgi:hypothetical protein